VDALRTALADSCPHRSTISEKCICPIHPHIFPHMCPPHHPSTPLPSTEHRHVPTPSNTERAVLLWDGHSNDQSSKQSNVKRETHLGVRESRPCKHHPPIHAPTAAPSACTPAAASSIVVKREMAPAIGPLTAQKGKKTCRLWREAT